MGDNIQKQTVWKRKRSRRGKRRRQKNHIQMHVGSENIDEKKHAVSRNNAKSEDQTLSKDVPEMKETLQVGDEELSEMSEISRNEISGNGLCKTVQISNEAESEDVKKEKMNVG